MLSQGLESSRQDLPEFTWKSLGALRSSSDVATTWLVGGTCIVGVGAVLKDLTPHTWARSYLQVTKFELQFYYFTYLLCSRVTWVTITGLTSSIVTLPLAPANAQQDWYHCEPWALRLVVVRGVGLVGLVKASMSQIVRSSRSFGCYECYVVSCHGLRACRLNPYPPAPIDSFFGWCEGAIEPQGMQHGAAHHTLLVGNVS